MRVLHVLRELKPSGAEIMLRAAGAHFAHAGVQSEILATGPQGVGPYATALEEAGYRVHHIPFRRDLGSLFRIARFMDAGCYDAIHIHTESASLYFGLAALRAAKGPVLRTIHNSFEFGGWLRLKRRLHRAILHRLGVVHIAISPSVEGTERTHFGNPTVVINNWFDTRRFRRPSEAERSVARTALALDSRQFAVASVGNCSEVKNHAAVIEALAQIAPPSRPVYLHVGIEERDQPERALAERLGVIANVRFLGPRVDVERVLYAADAFVMPSLYEGFGVAAIEALAVGLPCVLANCAGLRDFAPHFAGVILVRPDASSVRAGLEQAMSLAPDVRERMVTHYPEIARRLFGIEQGADRYLSLYRTEPGRTRLH